MEINCEVINGAFDVSSSAGNGHKAQDGGPGDDGLNNTPPVSNNNTQIIIIVIIINLLLILRQLHVQMIKCA